MKATELNRYTTRVKATEENRHTTRMKNRGSVVSLSFIFILPHPPEDEKEKKKKSKTHASIIFFSFFPVQVRCLDGRYDGGRGGEVPPVFTTRSEFFSSCTSDSAVRLTDKNMMERFVWHSATNHHRGNSCRKHENNITKDYGDRMEQWGHSRESISDPRQNTVQKGNPPLPLA